MEDDDEVISNTLVALSAIEKYGYLTRLKTPADEWYEIGTRPLEQEEYGERITMQTAVALISAGLVREVAHGHPPGDRTTRPSPTLQPRSASNKIRLSMLARTRPATAGGLFRIWATGIAETRFLRQAATGRVR